MDQNTNTDYIGNYDDIRIFVNDQWLIADEKYQQAYKIYISQYYYSSYPYVHRDGDNEIIISRLNNNHNEGTYIKYNNIELPIANLNNVRVFLYELPLLEHYHHWYKARQYQAWAYFDFLYSGKQSKTYISVGSQHFDNNDIQIIPKIYCKKPNVIFTIKRNENNSIYYEKNNEDKTCVLISDSSYVRRGYSGFVSRITMDVGLVSSSIFNFNDTKI